MAINETWRLAPWADALYACDQEWWDKRAPTPDEFNGLRIVGDGDRPECLSANVDAKVHRLILDGDTIGSGGNGGFQAMEIAIRCGSQFIILTGVDCHGGHWHPDHANGMRNPRATTFAGWVSAFNTAAKQIKRHGVTVINCSRDTVLTCFPRMTMEQALDHIGSTSGGA